nr:PAS domain S-box protein [Arenibacter sp. TNZ]
MASAKTFVDNKNITIGNYSEANGTASWKFDNTTGNLWFSPRFFNMIGYATDELELDSVDSWSDFVYFFDQDKFKDTWRNWSNNNLTDDEFECKMIHRSGDIVIVNIIINNSKTNDTGKLIFLEGDLLDITTQKKVWEQIELINPKYSSVIQAGYNWMAIVDIKGNYSYVNTTLESALEYSSEELIDKSFFHFIHDAERGKVTNYFSKFIQNEPFVSKPFRYRHKNGTWKWIEMLFVNLIDDPMIQGIVINARDITERVLINKEIKASEEKHRLLFNTSPYPKYILEIDSFRILDVNDAMVQFYGYSREEFMTMTALELRQKEEISKLLKGLEEFQLQSGTLKSGIYTHKKKNGELVKMDVVGQHLTIDEVKCVLATCSDVTEREKYLNELKQSEHKLKSATSIAKLGHWSLDLNNFYLSCSEEVYKIWERKQESVDLNYDSFVNTIHADDRDDFILKNKNTVAQNKVYDFVYRIILPGDTIKWIHQLGRTIFQDGSPNRMEGTVQDITQQKVEEQQLRLLESVVTNTKDAVLITEAEPFDEQGSKILYVNRAFTKMTGYTAEEIIGKTPKILQGPKSDPKELKRLNQAMRSWEPCEITTINYKKHGEEFWVNLSLSPVADEKGWFTHWISIERDVSDKKNQEIQKNLMIDISLLFGHEKDLKPCLVSILNYLTDFGGLAFGEIWLPNSENSDIQLFADYKNTNVGNIVQSKAEGEKPFQSSNGLVKAIWEKQIVEIWDTKDLKHANRNRFIKLLGLDKIIGIPLFHNEKFIGALILGSENGTDTQIFQSEMFQAVADHLAVEIKRKLVETELEHVFNFAPDILCKAGNDGFFKKINPAASRLLGYSEEELLSRKIIDFVHPDDRKKTRNQQSHLYSGKSYKYFENRYISKSGETIWLSWTARPSEEEGAIYAVAKDITENKDLKNLLNEVTDLAVIGGWELNFRTAQIYWSDMTKKIYEVDSNYTPTVESVLGFYQNEETKEKISTLINNAALKGEAWDLELRINTAKGNEQWLRMIGKPEFINGKCVRIFGSIQDINDLKASQVQMEMTNLEKNRILESIGDAFISVGNDWTVTYWNKMAEKLLMIARDQIIGKNMWDVLRKSVDSKTFLKHYKSIKTGKTVYFQEYFSVLNKWLEVSIYPSEKTLSLYIRDITEKRQGQIAIEKQNEKLREIAWTQSHIVRAPLARLMGIIDLFHENLIDDNEKIELLDNVYLSAIELDAIIHDIVQKSQSVVSISNK